MNQATSERLYSTSEGAAYLRVSVTKFLYAVRSRSIEGRRLGQQRAFVLADLERVRQALNAIDSNRSGGPRR